MNRTIYTALPRAVLRAETKQDCGSPSFAGLVTAMVADFATSPALIKHKSFIDMMRFFIFLWVVILSVLVTVVGVLWIMSRRDPNIRTFFDRGPPMARAGRMKWLRIFTVLQFFLIGVALFGWLIATNYNSMLRKNSKENKVQLRSFIESTTHQMRHVLIQNYKEFGDSFINSMNALTTNKVTEFRETLVENKFLKVDIFPSQIREIENLILDIDLTMRTLRTNTTQLQDYLRYFYRNETLMLKTSDEGKTILVATNFNEFKAKTLHKQRLNIIRNAMKALLRTVRDISRRYTTILQVPQTILSAVNTVYLNATEDLNKFIRSQGSILQSMHKMIKNRLSEDGNKDELTGMLKFFENHPYFLVICGIFVCVTVFLILLYLFIGMLFGACCDTKHNKVLAAKVIKRTVYAIISLYAIIVLIACWHFWMGAVLHNSTCARKSVRMFRCKPNETIYTNMRSRNLVSDISDLPKSIQYINRLITHLVARISRVTYKPLPLKSAQKLMSDAAEAGSMFKMGDVCVALKDELHLDYLLSVHKQIAAYAHNEMKNDKTVLPSGRTSRELTLCNLKFFNDHIIKKLLISDILVKAEAVVKKCKRLATFFSDDIEEQVKISLSSMNEMAKFYDNGFKAFLSAIPDDLTKLYKEQLEQYIQIANSSLTTKVGLCSLTSRSRSGASDSCTCWALYLNGFWCGVFLIAFALLPIVIIGSIIAYLLRRDVAECCIMTKDADCREGRGSRSKPKWMQGLFPCMRPTKDGENDQNLACSLEKRRFSTRVSAYHTTSKRTSAATDATPDRSQSKSSCLYCFKCNRKKKKSVTSVEYVVDKCTCESCAVRKMQTEAPAAETTATQTDEHSLPTAQTEMLSGSDAMSPSQGDHRHKRKSKVKQSLPERDSMSVSHGKRNRKSKFKDTSHSVAVSYTDAMCTCPPDKACPPEHHAMLVKHREQKNNKCILSSCKRKNKNEKSPERHSKSADRENKPCLFLSCSRRTKKRASSEPDAASVGSTEKKNKPLFVSSCQRREKKATPESDITSVGSGHRKNKSRKKKRASSESDTTNKPCCFSSCKTKKKKASPESDTASVRSADGKKKPCFVSSCQTRDRKRSSAPDAIKDGDPKPTPSLISLRNEKMTKASRESDTASIGSGDVKKKRSSSFFHKKNKQKASAESDTASIGSGDVKKKRSLSFLHKKNKQKASAESDTASIGSGDVKKKRSLSFLHKKNKQKASAESDTASIGSGDLKKKRSSSFFHKKNKQKASAESDTASIGSGDVKKKPSLSFLHKKNKKKASADSDTASIGSGDVKKKPSLSFLHKKNKKKASADSDTASIGSGDVKKKRSLSFLHKKNKQKASAESDTASIGSGDVKKKRSSSFFHKKNKQKASAESDTASIGSGDVKKKRSSSFFHKKNKQKASAESDTASIGSGDVKKKRSSSFFHKKNKQRASAESDTASVGSADGKRKPCFISSCQTKEKERSPAPDAIKDGDQKQTPSLTSLRKKKKKASRESRASVGPADGKKKPCFFSSCQRKEKKATPESDTQSVGSENRKNRPCIFSSCKTKKKKASPDSDTASVRSADGKRKPCFVSSCQTKDKETSPAPDAIKDSDQKQTPSLSSLRKKKKKRASRESDTASVGSADGKNKPCFFLSCQRKESDTRSAKKQEILSCCQDKEETPQETVARPVHSVDIKCELSCQASCSKLGRSDEGPSTSKAATDEPSIIYYMPPKSLSNESINKIRNNSDDKLSTGNKSATSIAKSERTLSFMIKSQSNEKVLSIEHNITSPESANRSVGSMVNKCELSCKASCSRYTPPRSDSTNVLRSVDSTVEETMLAVPMKIERSPSESDKVGSTTEGSPTIENLATESRSFESHQKQNPIPPNTYGTLSETESERGPGSLATKPGLPRYEGGKMVSISSMSSSSATRTDGSSDIKNSETELLSFDGNRFVQLKPISSGSDTTREIRSLNPTVEECDQSCMASRTKHTFRESHATSHETILAVGQDEDKLPLPTEIKRSPSKSQELPSTSSMATDGSSVNKNSTPKSRANEVSQISLVDNNVSPSDQQKSGAVDLQKVPTSLSKKQVITLDYLSNKVKPTKFSISLSYGEASDKTETHLNDRKDKEVISSAIGTQTSSPIVEQNEQASSVFQILKSNFKMDRTDMKPLENIQEPASSSIGVKQASTETVKVLEKSTIPQKDTSERSNDKESSPAKDKLKSNIPDSKPKSLKSYPNSPCRSGTSCVAENDNLSTQNQHTTPIGVKQAPIETVKVVEKSTIPQKDTSEMSNDTESTQTSSPIVKQNEQAYSVMQILKSKFKMNRTDMKPLENIQAPASSSIGVKQASTETVKVLEKSTIPQKDTSERSNDKESSPAKDKLKSNIPDSKPKSLKSYPNSPCRSRTSCVAEKDNSSTQKQHIGVKQAPIEAVKVLENSTIPQKDTSEVSNDTESSPAKDKLKSNIPDSKPRSLKRYPNSPCRNRSSCVAEKDNSSTQKQHTTPIGVKQAPIETVKVLEKSTIPQKDTSETSNDKESSPAKDKLKSNLPDSKPKSLKSYPNRPRRNRTSSVAEKEKSSTQKQHKKLIVRKKFSTSPGHSRQPYMTDKQELRVTKINKASIMNKQMDSTANSQQPTSTKTQDLNSFEKKKRPNKTIRVKKKKISFVVKKQKSDPVISKSDRKKGGFSVLEKSYDIGQQNTVHRTTSLPSVKESNLLDNAQASLIVPTKTSHIIQEQKTKLSSHREESSFKKRSKLNPSESIPKFLKVKKKLLRIKQREESPMPQTRVVIVNGLQRHKNKVYIQRMPKIGSKFAQKRG